MSFASWSGSVLNRHNYLDSVKHTSFGMLMPPRLPLVGMRGTARGAIDAAELAVLKQLALDGGTNGTHKTSCNALGDTLEVSTQTASRRLQELETAGLIKRDTVADGQWISITEDGRWTLHAEYVEYRQLFEGVSTVELTGTVESGMGEGRHYVSQPGYMDQFEQRLGYTPFLGTLNVGLTEASEQRRGGLASLSPIHIDGFETEDRTFGPASCYPASIVAGENRYDRAHVIEPERTHHEADSIELIAPDKLRETLGVSDDDRIRVIVAES